MRLLTAALRYCGRMDGAFLQHERAQKHGSCPDPRGSLRGLLPISAQHANAKPSSCQRPFGWVHLRRVQALRCVRS